MLPLIRTFIIALTLTFAGSVAAQDSLNIYGPGGPLPAMKEAAAAFQQETGIAVTVTAGPTPQWLPKAKEDADLIFSGAEHMMSDFVQAMDGRIVEASIRPLYLRPSVILVRDGNPKSLKGMRDLLAPGLKILVVHGAGQIGLWEDIIGRTGDIEAVRAFRANIVAFAPNSAKAAELWKERGDIDAWVIWNIWGANGRTPTNIVPIEQELRIYRDTGIAFTQRGQGKESAKQFAAFLASPRGRAIFEKWGWIEKAS